MRWKIGLCLMLGPVVLFALVLIIVGLMYAPIPMLIALAVLGVMSTGVYLMETAD